MVSSTWRLLKSREEQKTRNGEMLEDTETFFGPKWTSLMHRASQIGGASGQIRDASAFPNWMLKCPSLVIPGKSVVLKNTSSDEKKNEIAAIYSRREFVLGQSTLSLSPSPCLLSPSFLATAHQSMNTNEQRTAADRTQFSLPYTLPHPFSESMHRSKSFSLFVNLDPFSPFASYSTLYHLWSTLAIL